MARVLELAPLEPMYGWFMTQALCLAGHHERAIAQAEATLAIDPHYMPIFWWLGTAQWLLGRREEAVETVTKLLPFGDAMGDGLYAFFAGQLGRTDEARAAAVKLETQWHEGHLLQGTALVSAWVGVGETDRALDWLETACEERNASLVLLSVPWFDTLRAEPRFQAVLRTVGL